MHLLCIHVTPNVYIVHNIFISCCYITCNLPLNKMLLLLYSVVVLHLGRHNKANPARWKANFRCAIDSLKDVEKVKELSVSKGHNAFMVYRMLDCRRKTDKPRPVKRRKADTDIDVKPEITEDFVKGNNKYSVT